VIAFGEPLVRQLRNPHDLWKDLEDEFANNRATDPFVRLLRSVPLTAANYMDALDELIRKCLDRLHSSRDLPQADVTLMKDFFREYQVWHGVFSTIPVR